MDKKLFIFKNLVNGIEEYYYASINYSPDEVLEKHIDWYNTDFLDSIGSDNYISKNDYRFIKSVYFVDVD